MLLIFSTVFAVVSSTISFWIRIELKQNCILYEINVNDKIIDSTCFDLVRKVWDSGRNSRSTGM